MGKGGVMQTVGTNSIVLVCIWVHVYITELLYITSIHSSAQGVSFF